MEKQKHIYIVDALRTPIGSANKSFKGMSAAQLAAALINELGNRHREIICRLDEVVIGNTVSAGTGQNLAREAVILAGLPETVPAYTVNAVCGAGLQAVINAVNFVKANQSGVVIAGAAESASNSPLIQQRGKETFAESLIYDGLRCAMTQKHMGQLCDETAQEYSISRKEQDEWALKSHQKAIEAQSTKENVGEIVPCATERGGSLTCDERPRKNTSLERLSRLPPAFYPHGTITAGNACAPADGAAAVVISSSDSVENIEGGPLARIVHTVSIAVDPKDVFIAGIDAIRTCLDETGLTVADIDLFEICEAFASQVLITRNELGIPDEKINVWGGDVALGHPLGAAGLRCLVSLCHALKKKECNRGIVCACFGGGGAIAAIIEVVK